MKDEGWGVRDEWKLGIEEIMSLSKDSIRGEGRVITNYIWIVTIAEKSISREGLPIPGGTVFLLSPRFLRLYYFLLSFFMSNR